MTTDRSQLWAPRRVPDHVVDAARRAFDERNPAGTLRLDLVFDSLEEGGWSRTGASRVLMFAGSGCAVLLMSTREHDVNELSGAVFSTTGAATVALRRPRQATITIPSTPDGRLEQLSVATGPACVFTRDTVAGRTWQSDWLTI